MTSRSVLLVIVLAGLVTVPVAAHVPAQPQDGQIATDSPGHASIGSIAQTGSDFDRATFIITVYRNGSARWTFQYARSLRNESERQDFRTFAEDFNENSTELYRNFRGRATKLAEDGGTATGRSMNATAFSKTAFVSGLDDDLGVVEMSFIWTGFAATADGPVIGDVFQGGLYIGPDQTLRVETGPDLAFRDGVSPEPDAMTGDSVTGSKSITWNGERQFADQRPHVPFRAADGTPTDGTTGGGLPGGLGLVILVVVVLLGGGAAFIWRSGVLDGDGGGTARSAGGDDGGATAEDVTGEPAIADEAFLSDEDRVVQLLEDSGGRMKQVDIVEDTGWSKSKVSMLLSDMEEEETISKLRVGRENVISLKGHEPEAAKSPFEEDE